MRPEELVERMQTPGQCTAALVNEYYTRCIPTYRELLGNHWHTGFYLFDDRPIGPADQLRMENRIAVSANLNDQCQALDVGSGIGGPACHLARLTGARIYGVTPNAAQVHLARQLAGQTGVDDRVEFTQAYAHQLPYPDNTFDVVLFFESPCHFPDRIQFFREIRRVLKPGGRLTGEDWLMAENIRPPDLLHTIQPICTTWAIPALGTCSGYAADMMTAGLIVKKAVDLRSEMALERGFAVTASDQDQLRRDHETSTDPIRKIIMQGLLLLGKAVAAGTFTLGRFLAIAEKRRTQQRHHVAKSAATLRSFRPRNKP